VSLAVNLCINCSFFTFICLCDWRRRSLNRFKIQMSRYP